MEPEVNEDELRDGVLVTEFPDLPKEPVESDDSELAQQLAKERAIAAQVGEPSPPVEWNPTDAPTNLNNGIEGPLPAAPEEGS